MIVVLVLETDWIMVISSVCFLVDETCASFLMVGTGCGLNCCLALVERAVLSKTLIQLSADGFGCAPSCLVVWPEMTQS